MTSIIVPAGEDIAVHLTDDDVSWYVAVTNPTDGTTVLADSATAAVAALIDGYSGEDPEEAFLQRFDYAVRTTALQQGLVAVAAQEEGTFDVATAGEDVLTALFSDRGEVAEVSEWTLPLPFIHVASHYEPYTETPRPSGENVFLIDPYTEVTLLVSLSAAGTLDVSFRDEDSGEDDVVA
ncbi:hypothetical protein [Curtobacterium sp. MCBD17_040]|uniref:hypothetical protein n=1 Tax=Curtobacterium sp. MCBD17_040 TaxID=2175674 RepID=UPI000DA86C3E|nr:hypothetical protein [Curtobacterium sp. MCBD17_040]WIB65624.1 hypothetical protein DEI94_16015 [Curtobacterium sp. MCBD17_040]